MASSTSFPTGAHGLQPLHVAVIANDLASVKQLLRHGANIDMRTRAGATPLMLACLFARRRMMLLLLTKKASHKVKDSSDHTVRDYLRPHPRILARFHHPAFRNILARSKKGRSRIKRDFCSREAFRSRTKSRDHPLRDCVFHPQKGRIELLNVVSVVKPGPGAHDDKTRGCIAGEGHEKPTVFAISGWADDSRAGILGNSEYTDKVRAVCKELQFTLPVVKYNNATELEENEGKGMACHVEKQLSVFWLEQALKSKGQNALTKASIASLKNVTLPHDRRHAFIFLDHKPCKNCWDFLEVLREVSGIEFTTACRPFVGHRKRERRSFCRPDQIPTGPSQGADDSGHPRWEDRRTTEDENREDSHNGEDASRNWAFETYGYPDNVSHVGETQSHVSLEHRRRDTPSPDVSYMGQVTPPLIRSDFFQTTPSPPRSQEPVLYPKGKTPATQDPTEREITDSLARKNDLITSHPRSLIPFAVPLNGTQPELRHPIPPSTQPPAYNPFGRELGISAIDYASFANSTPMNSDVLFLDEDGAEISEAPRSSPAAARLERVQGSVSRLVSRSSRPHEVGANLPNAVSTPKPLSAQDTRHNRSRSMPLNLPAQRPQEVNRTGEYRVGGGSRARTSRSTGRSRIKKHTVRGRTILDLSEYAYAGK